MQRATAGGAGVEVIFLTVADVATVLRTTPKAVYCMIDRGKLAGVTRIGRRILINRTVLLSDLDGKTAASPSR
jgi:excisionase family DNA binding protein